MFGRLKKAVASFLTGTRPDPVQGNPKIYGPEVHHIDPTLVSESARITCERLQDRGYDAFIVGGAVRDLLLGVAPKDFDVATNATPEQIKRCQRRAVIVGKRFRLVHVIFGSEVIECSTFRALDAVGIRKDSTGRVISDNAFGSMWEDAARRDFTVNALYYDPTHEEIIDYHNGFEDVARKRLRMIGDPETRYREDPVRMLRAVRIAAKLGFSIESATERPIPKLAKLLANIPAARLQKQDLATQIRKELRPRKLQEAANITAHHNAPHLPLLFKMVG
ncbi:MAG: polynucleotide adenylyltransferase PcnB, partial [Duodenibacillus sp.]|nr:polynucleotide adenylyltransferase PcnB [Duodenibacillus sp.]